MLSFNKKHPTLLGLINVNALINSAFFFRERERERETQGYYYYI